MTRTASLYPTNQPSSRPASSRHRRIDRNSYLHSPTGSRSKPTLRFSDRPRSLAYSNHTTRKPSFFGRRSQSPYQPSRSTWKEKLGLRSRSYQQPPQPLSLEEKLRVAANRIRRFERQTRPQARPQVKHQTRTKYK